MNRDLPLHPVDIEIVTRVAKAVESMPRDEVLRLRADYCKQHGVPTFAPHDGTCYKCGKDMVEGHKYTWLNGGPTGCPHCHWSYCD